MGKVAHIRDCTWDDDRVDKSSGMAAFIMGKIIRGINIEASQHAN